MRNITWPQVALFLGSVALVLVAMKYVPGTGANLTAVMGLLINFMLGRDNPPSPPSAPLLPVLFAVGGSWAFFGALACGASNLEAPKEIREHARKLEQCKAEGRDAGDFFAYEQCKKREGL